VREAATVHPVAIRVVMTSAPSGTVHASCVRVPDRAMDAERTTMPSRRAVVNGFPCVIEPDA
jgi:hypothetical protein